MSTPTPAHPHLLDRDLSKAHAAELIELACPLLRELVNFGTGTLVRCLALSPRSKDGRFTCHVLYRQIIEATDGVEVLLSQCCAVPAVPILRSSFEALLSLIYVLEDDAKYALRSDAWVVGYARQRRAFFEILDPQTNKGKTFVQFMMDSPSKRERLNISAEAIRSARVRLDKLLADPKYHEIDAEYTRQKKRRPEWYSLFGGPQTLYELAKHFHFWPEYELLYRQWSRSVHAQDPLHSLTPAMPGQTFLDKLRQPKDLPFTGYFAAMFLIGSTTRMLTFFRPDEDAKPWYNEQVSSSIQ